MPYGRPPAAEDLGLKERLERWALLVSEGVAAVASLALAPSAAAWPVAVALAAVSGTFALLLRRFEQGWAALAIWPAMLALLLATSLFGGLAGLSGRSIDWRGRAVGGTGAS